MPTDIDTGHISKRNAQTNVEENLRTKITKHLSEENFDGIRSSSGARGVDPIQMGVDVSAGRRVSSETRCSVHSGKRLFETQGHVRWVGFRVSFNKTCGKTS